MNAVNGILGIGLLISLIVVVVDVVFDVFRMHVDEDSAVMPALAETALPITLASPEPHRHNVGVQAVPTRTANRMTPVAITHPAPTPRRNAGENRRRVCGVGTAPHQQHDETLFPIFLWLCALNFGITGTSKHLSQMKCRCGFFIGIPISSVAVRYGKD